MKLRLFLANCLRVLGILCLMNIFFISVIFGIAGIVGFFIWPLYVWLPLLIIAGICGSITKYKYDSLVFLFGKEVCYSFLSQLGKLPADALNFYLQDLISRRLNDYANSNYDNDTPSTLEELKQDVIHFFETDKEDENNNENIKEDENKKS